VTRMRRRSVRVILVVVVLPFLALSVWELLFHGPCDTKDLRYQAWKHGLYPMGMDSAMETMLLDAHRDDLAVGKTEAELRARFGYVSSLANANEYVKYCYDNSPYRGRQALILRNSNGMVLMKDGRAEQLLFVKGC